MSYKNANTLCRFFSVLITYFPCLVKRMQGEWDELGFLVLLRCLSSLIPPFPSMHLVLRTRKYLRKHNNFSSVFIYCLDSAMDHSCASHLPSDLSSPVHNSHGLVTDREVNDGLGLGATFRHYLECEQATKYLQYQEVTYVSLILYPSNLTSSVPPKLPSFLRSTSHISSNTQEMEILRIIHGIPRDS